MATRFLPPQEPLTDGSGLISHNWWRSLQGLTQIQVQTATPRLAALTAQWSAADEIRVTLADPVVTITNAGASDGQRCVLTLIQDTAGGRLASFTGETDFGTAGAPTLSTAPGARDHIEFIFNAAAGVYDAVLFAGGFG